MAIKNEIIRLLEKIEQGKYSNVILNELFQQKEFRRAERNFITEVFYGVLRNKIYLDYMISIYVKDMKKEWLRQLFCISFYQIRFMESDNKGVIWEGTELSKKKYGLGLSKFVNGVLRNFQRNWKKEENILFEKGRKDIRYSFPKWFFDRILKAFPNTYQEVLLSLKKTPYLSFRVNQLKYSCESFEKKLEETGIEIIKKVGPVYYVKAGFLLYSKEFKEGKIVVQDAASYLAAKNLQAKEGETVLDACSAPGGKTAVLAEGMNNLGTVIALDIHTHKIKLIEENCKKLGISIVQATKLDARHLNLQGKKFDKILVDAPCSGYGVLSKKPEGLYTKKEENIQELVKLQREILHSASEVLKIGGELVYSTCTILPEENEENIAWFLQNHPNFISKKVEIPSNVKGLRDNFGAYSINFEEEILDSFYIAKFYRKA